MISGFDALYDAVDEGNEVLAKHEEIKTLQIQQALFSVITLIK